MYTTLHSVVVEWLLDSPAEQEFTLDQLPKLPQVSHPHLPMSLLYVSHPQAEVLQDLYDSTPHAAVAHVLYDATPHTDPVLYSAHPHAAFAQVLYAATPHAEPALYAAQPQAAVAHVLYDATPHADVAQVFYAATPHADVAHVLLTVLVLYPICVRQSQWFGLDDGLHPLCVIAEILPL